MSPDRVELHARFSGHVQGVGFRWRTQQCMSGIDVDGWVRNLADGRVELLLQGREELVLAALSRVRTRLAENITSVDVERRAPSSALAPGFRIRR